MKRNNWEHPKLAKITTARILGLMAGTGFFAYDISQGVHNDVQTFYHPNRQKDFVATVFEYSNGTLISKTSFPREIIIAVALHTTSLSAQNEIEVQAISRKFDNISEEELKGMPNTLVLIFPQAIHQPIDFVNDLSPNIGYVKIYLNENNKRYEGSDKILYQFESDGGFFLRTPENIGGEYLKSEQIEKHGDRTETRTLTLVGDLQELVYSPSRFPVEPVSTTDNMKMNNIIQAISILIINIGLIQSRKQIILGVFFCFRNIHRGVT